MRRKLLCLMILVPVLGLVGNASADIAFDDASSGANGSGGETLSWSHTIGSGSNRLLVVLPLAEDPKESDSVITSVTYNSVSMTEVSGSNIWQSPLRGNMYYMLDSSLPSAGTYTVEVTYNGKVSDLAGGAISLRNVKQQAPEAVATGSDPDNNIISTNITTQTDGAWVVDLVGGDSNESFVTTTSGMTERFDDAGSGAHTAAGSTKPVASAGSTTMSWEFDAGGSVLVHTLAAFEPSSPYMYWEDNFPDITVTEHITEQNDEVSGSSTATLNTSGDAEISADNNTTAQLSCGSCTLVTEYRLTFDDAGGTTGVDTGEGEGGGDEWQLYNVFLTTGTEGDVTHVQYDNDVEITLHIRASNHAGQLADAGTYTAKQTLTAHWVGP